MSNRSWNTEALVLSVSSLAATIGTCRFVPQEHGCTIVPATLSAAHGVNCGDGFYLSERASLALFKPDKNSNKITDFSVSAYRMELRESLARSWCAAVCSEITIKPAAR